MHYKKLIEASWLWEKDRRSPYYWQYRKMLRWNSPWDFSDTDLRCAVDFLNKWNCRIHITDSLIKNIKKVCLKTKQSFQRLREFCLEDVDFANQQVKSDILFIFREFNMIGERFGSVATSKFIHMVHPALFVMWDNPIQQKFGIHDVKDPFEYLRFMHMMREEIDEALKTYMDEFKCTRENAIKELKEKCSSKNFAKLVDEYNWLTYTRKGRPIVPMGNVYSNFKEKEKYSLNKVNRSINSILIEFQKKLERNNVAESSIDTHIRRVSTYLRFCKSTGIDPYSISSKERFIEDRKQSGCQKTSIVAYKQSLNVLFRYFSRNS